MILSAQVVIDKPSSSGGTDTSYVNQKLAEAKTYTDNTLIGLQSSIDVLVADKTVNLNSTMTATAIQDSINKQPRNLGGKILTFQFTDGTYNLTTALIFTTFYNGSLKIYGDVTNTSVSLEKDVVLITANNARGIIIKECNCYAITINSIKFIIVSTTNDGLISAGIFVENTNNVVVTRNSFQQSANSILYGTGINIAYFSFVRVQECFFDYLFQSIKVFAGGRALSYSHGYSHSSSYGLAADSGEIMKRNSSQPSGSVVAEYTENGGLIR